MRGLLMKWPSLTIGWNNKADDDDDRGESACLASTVRELAFNPPTQKSYYVISDEIRMGIQWDHC